VVEFYGRHERISEKQDGSLVGRTPGFVVSTVNCLSTIYVLSWLFLSQVIFPFHSFCFHNFSPPLRKILAAPLVSLAVMFVHILFTNFHPCTQSVLLFALHEPTTYFETTAFMYAKK